jgi:hypothetical protein
MRRPARRAIAVAVAGAVWLSFVAPSVAARPRPELTGCKGECRKVERKCSGDCQKTHSACVVQCGCPSGHHCTETQKACMGQCNLRMNGCVQVCRGAFGRCAAKC